MDTRDILLTMTISGVSPALAAVFSNPLDVAKTRLQMQNELQHAKTKVYNGPIDCIAKTYRREGIRGVQRGLHVAMIRETSKCFFRIGLYDPLLSYMHDLNSGKPPIYKRVGAGATAGVVAALITNPLEITKSRIQATGALTNAHLKYSTAREAIMDTLRKDSVWGLWKGVRVSMLRSMVWTGVQLPCNSYLKERWFPVRPESTVYALYQDGVCAMGSSFAALCFQNPLDVVRTRLFNQPHDNSLYKRSLPQVFMQILRAEGPTALYKGFWAYYLRAGPHSVLTFAFIGQFKRLFNMS